MREGKSWWQSTRLNDQKSEYSQSLLFSSHYPLIVLKNLPYYFALVNVLKIPSADSIWH